MAEIETKPESVVAYLIHVMKDKGIVIEIMNVLGILSVAQITVEKTSFGLPLTAVKIRIRRLKVRVYYFTSFLCNFQ